MAESKPSVLLLYTVSLGPVDRRTYIAVGECLTGEMSNLRSDLLFGRHHTLFNRSRTRYASGPSRLKQRTKVDVGGLQFHGDDHGNRSLLSASLILGYAPHKL